MYGKSNQQEQAVIANLSIRTIAPDQPADEDRDNGQRNETQKVVIADNRIPQRNQIEPDGRAVKSLRVHVVEVITPVLDETCGAKRVQPVQLEEQCWYGYACEGQESAAQQAVSFPSVPPSS